MGIHASCCRYLCICGKKRRRRYFIMLLVIGSLLALNSFHLAVHTLKYRDKTKLGADFFNNQLDILMKHVTTPASPFKNLPDLLMKPVGNNNLSDLRKEMPLNAKGHRSTIKTSLKTKPDLKTKPSSGEKLAREVQKRCSTLTSRFMKRSTSMKITTSSQYQLMFCPMCKLASTFWTRFFKMLELNKTSPYDIPISAAPPSTERLKFVRGIPTHNFDHMYKFLFVRNPYSRILSAFVDKFFAPNPTYWNLVSLLRKKNKYRGRKVVKKYSTENRTKEECGSNFTFEEYVKILNRIHERERSVDCHDTEYHLNCHVCQIEYDFVGKMETFVEDSFHIFRNLGLNASIAKLSQNFSYFANEDALFDTVTSPFGWRENIEKCITWDEALKRVWRKLQIRGILGKFEFPLTLEQSTNISATEFMGLVRDYQNKTSPLERKQQKQEALIEIYRKVPFNELVKLRKAFNEDFILFGYNNTPADIFDRSKDIRFYGYLDI